jgi:Tol biopolymer transport system component
VRPASGQGEETLLHTAGAQVWLSDWSTDGRLILFDRTAPDPGVPETWALDVETGEAERILPGQASFARLSHDGRWIAFVSNESGKPEIYVQSFPEGTGRWMVSSDSRSTSAGQPSWRGNDREIYYLRAGELFAVPLSGEGTLSFGTPRFLFGITSTSVSTQYGATFDGQRFLTNELPPTDPDKLGARLIQNWTRTLAR